jgi:hypothetical protein
MDGSIVKQNIGMTVDEMMYQKKRLAELMSKVLKKDEHYGVIPGTKKNTLYKSGAEIIALTFGVHPTFEVEMTDLKKGHREYEVSCQMFRNSDKMEVGGGVGMCSTMEKKYRYRTVKKFNEKTEKQEDTQIENPNIEDLHNTVLKMAKKRAFVDAVITTTGASDFVTQDLEDFDDVQNPIDDKHLQEIKAIDNLKILSKYWKENSGKGKEFDKAIMDRKKELESNQKENK